MDKDQSGQISVGEFLDFFGIERTGFNARSFAVMDIDGSQELSFFEFVLSIWNYGTLSKETLIAFAFDLYDLDGSGAIGAEEVTQMCAELYGAAWKENASARATSAELVAALEGAGCDLELPRFAAFVATHSALLFPAFKMQATLRGKVLGVAHWGKLSKERETWAADPESASEPQREVLLKLKEFHKQCVCSRV